MYEFVTATSTNYAYPIVPLSMLKICYTTMLLEEFKLARNTLLLSLTNVMAPLYPISKLGLMHVKDVA